MWNNVKNRLYFGVGILLLIVISLTASKTITISEGMNLVILIGLVAVTAIYAMRTAEIAKATKEQAEASSRPYLLLRLTNEMVTWPPPNNELNVTIRNEGKGPAINIEASLWHPKTVHPYDSKGYLASGEEWQVNISVSDVGVPYEGEEEVRPWLPELKDIIREFDVGVVVVQYHDIHSRKWLSYLSFEKIEEDIPIIRDGDQNIVEWEKHD